MLRTQIYLPSEHLRELKTIAWTKKTTISQVLREMISEKIEDKETHKAKKGKKNTGQWLLSLANEAEGLGFKGPKDLSSNVDKYLYGGK